MIYPIAQSVNQDIRIKRCSIGQINAKRLSGSGLNRRGTGSRPNNCSETAGKGCEATSQASWMKSIFDDFIGCRKVPRLYPMDIEQGGIDACIRNQTPLPELL